jgi:hypothetical protein
MAGLSRAPAAAVTARQHASGEASREASGEASREASAAVGACRHAAAKFQKAAGSSSA